MHHGRHQAESPRGKAERENGGGMLQRLIAAKGCGGHLHREVDMNPREWNLLNPQSI
jgi:hypothetical protein